MHAQSLFRLIYLSLTLLLLAACASRPAMEWSKQDFTGQIKHVLVIAAIERSTRRRVFEDEFIDAMAPLQVEATPSYMLMTTTTTVTQKTVDAAIAQKQIDAVLVTRLLGVKEDEKYQPPTESADYDNYYAYYTEALEQDASGSYRRFKILTLETNLYDAATRKLIWSRRSASIETTAPRVAINEQITLTVNAMQQSGLIVIE